MTSFEASKNPVEEQKPDIKETIINQSFINWFTDKVTASAKEISPESNRNWELDYITDKYKMKMGLIEELSITPEKKNNMYQNATLFYINAIRTKVGTTEWSQAKLVEDGKKANTEVNETNEQWTKDWKQLLQEFSDKIDGERNQKKQNNEKWQIREAQEWWNREIYREQMTASATMQKFQEPTTIV